jgi:hypothetical protein
MYDMSSEMFMTLTVKIVVLGAVTACRFVSSYRRFGGIFCLHLEDGSNEFLRKIG